MELIDKVEVGPISGPRSIELHHGDLTDLRPDEAVDILILSAFPGDYSPTPSSLIGQLAMKGVWVGTLAQDKAVDLRKTSSCWVSEPIRAKSPGIAFDRILCFEPESRRGSPTELVGDIFRCLAPVVGADGFGTSAALPLVACGNQRVPVERMLVPLFEAAFHWMNHGLALDRLKIVIYSRSDVEEAALHFARLKTQYQPVSVSTVPGLAPKYDVFVSYAHKDSEVVDRFVSEIRRHRSDLRFFLDRVALNPGVSWQRDIYEALEECRKVMVMLTPAYLESRRCQEEYNMAHCRQVDSGETILSPIFISDTKLPLYMRMIEHVDCREGDLERLVKAISRSWP